MAMISRLRVASLAFLVAVVVLSPLSVSAATTTPDRSALLAQIETLLAELVRLKAQATVQAQIVGLPAPVAAPTEVYQSRYLTDTPFEAVYAVGTSGLTRIDQSGGPRVIDLQLFDLFKKVVGTDEIRRYVDDFRVFYGDKDDTVSAFVETKTRSNKWLIAVNRDGYVPGKRLAKAAFIELYLHEYAHLLLYEYKKATAAYTEAFWTAADARHSERLGEAEDRFKLMNEYYDAHPDRFVSDYATLSVNEDMAETFVTFIITNKPRGRSERDEKIRFFYKYPELVTERDRLRENLVVLGVAL